MKAFLYSQDGSYAFPLAPKVTTIGRENCDISINVRLFIDFSRFFVNSFYLVSSESAGGSSARVDRVRRPTTMFHSERSEFVGRHFRSRLSSSERRRSFVRRRCRSFRTQRFAAPAALRPGERVDDAVDLSSLGQFQRLTNHFANDSFETLHKWHHQRANTTNRCSTKSRISNAVRSKKRFLLFTFVSLRNRPSSAGAKKGLSTTTNSSTVVRCETFRLNEMKSIRFLSANAWTISSNNNRGTINGSFSADLDIPPSADTTEIVTRVDQLEREVKGRDTEIRQLNERVKNERLLVSLLERRRSFSSDRWNRSARRSPRKFTRCAANWKKSNERKMRRPV